MRAVRICQLFVLCIAIVTSVFAQSGVGTRSAAGPAPSPRVHPPAWGTATPTYYVIGGWEFRPYAATDPPLGGLGSGAVGGGAVGQNHDSHPHLPSGALVTGLEITGCKANASQMFATLYECDVTSTCTSRGQAFSSIAASGCDFYFGDVLPNLTVNNFDNNYIVELNLGPTAGNTITAVRIYYKLQVSPAPLTQTFNDVPVGHPFHRFVEALFRAGITGGCGGGNYCPNAPITRGEMAVFLTGALGMHWPD